MNKADFKIVNENGDVSIVRTHRPAAHKAASSPQKMRVMCFDPAQIDRIFGKQEAHFGAVVRK